ncbi:hypothetical protein [Haloarchaeobius sp. DFWS5]|uniref:DUF7845 domain-containing protein n=1 Tax=Haloarchaeobius sp. DFWS5 TaxID=3446114 RepID=UPI003EBB9E8C
MYANDPAGLESPASTDSAQTENDDDAVILVEDGILIADGGRELSSKELSLLENDYASQCPECGGVVFEWQDACTDCDATTTDSTEQTTLTDGGTPIPEHASDEYGTCDDCGRTRLRAGLREFDGRVVCPSCLRLERPHQFRARFVFADDVRAYQTAHDHGSLDDHTTTVDIDDRTWAVTVETVPSGLATTQAPEHELPAFQFNAEHHGQHALFGLRPYSPGHVAYETGDPYQPAGEFAASVLLVETTHVPPNDHLSLARGIIRGVLGDDTLLDVGLHDTTSVHRCEKIVRVDPSTLTLTEDTA